MTDRCFVGPRHSSGKRFNAKAEFPSIDTKGLHVILVDDTVEVTVPGHLEKNNRLDIYCHLEQVRGFVEKDELDIDLSSQYA